MPSLKALLQKTMIFTAAAPTDLYAKKMGSMAMITPTPPTATTSGPPEDRAVWNWKHEPLSPAKITNLTAIVRAMNNMTMTVCESIEVERVAITVNHAPNGKSFEVPLTEDFVVAKFQLDQGHIPDSTTGWWRIVANVDWSLMVVFAYEIGNWLTDQPTINRVPLSSLESDTSFPNSDVPSDDPDYIDPASTTPPGSGTPGEAKTVETTVTAVPPPIRVVVVFGFTTCKERGDFEPGHVLGAGRFYPHVMITATRSLAACETTIHLKRPATAMTEMEMDGKMGQVLATDTNTPGGPVPIWSNVFDYVVTDPVGQIGTIGAGDKDGSGSNWMTVVDPSKGARPINGKIRRETITHIPHFVDTANFTKLASQGEFDNLHVAPGMKFTMKNGTVLQPIKMAPFCVHDCMHTHFRWGNFTPFSLPKSNLGFTGRQPYTGTGSPLVPQDHTVLLGLTSAFSFRYLGRRAQSPNRIMPQSTWTVFNHHGSGYALGIASDILWNGARFGAFEYVTHKFERFGWWVPNSIDVITDVDPAASIAAFYFRLRFTGSDSAGWVERLQILDLSTTTGVRS
jgi:hypothetical protein